MNTSLVLIVNAGSLLMDGVTDLLEANLDGRSDVVSISVRDRHQVIHEIERLNPAVVVMEDSTPYITPADLLASLHHIEKIRVIVLSIQVNQADIYDKFAPTFYRKSELAVADPARFLAAFDCRSAPYV